MLSHRWLYLPASLGELAGWRCSPESRYYAHRGKVDHVCSGCHRFVSEFQHAMMFPDNIHNPTCDEVDTVSYAVYEEKRPIPRSTLELHDLLTVCDKQIREHSNRIEVTQGKVKELVAKRQRLMDAGRWDGPFSRQAMQIINELTTLRKEERARYHQLTQAKADVDFLLDAYKRCHKNVYERAGCAIPRLPDSHPMAIPKSLGERRRRRIRLKK